MFDALVTLYQSENINQKKLMRNKLGATQMSKRNIIASYLMKVTKLHDQLEAVGEEVEGEDFVTHNPEWVFILLVTFCLGCVYLR